MEDYSNIPIDTLDLPRFEEVQLTPLRAGYYKIVLINIALFYLLLAIAIGIGIYYLDEARPYLYTAIIISVIMLVLTLVISRISFKNKGYAFRTHDVIYRSGALALTTTIIPYNRVQHVAVHEGFISRKLGLAAVEVFTAGGNSSDVKIPGMDKQHAEKIKQLLMGKVLNEETDAA